jgi:hypothetical protein
MEYKNALELAEAHVTDILAIIEEMGQRGIRVDRARLDEFNATLDSHLGVLTFQFEHDPELEGLGGYSPKGGYKKLPTRKINCFDCGTTGMVPAKRAGKEKKCPTCKGTRRMAIVTYEGLTQIPGTDKWAHELPFLPTSGEQVKAYMGRMGHDVPFDKKGDETTATKQLLLASRKYKDDRYLSFVEYRKYKKLRGTYGDWPLEQRGDEFYVKTKFSLRPDTHRLSSIAPNVQNIPKDGPLSKAFRRCLVPRPGHKFIKVDLSSAEALVTGWLAGDPSYMRLAQLGMHKYAMATYLGLPVSTSMSDEQLKPILAGVKDRDPRLYRQMKVVIYGGNYLAGARTVFLNNPEDFASEAEAKKFLAFCNGLSPKVQQWKKRVMAQAKQARGLTNPFGYHKPFWDLPGRDGPAACAFLPQSIVAAVMKEIMLQLWYTKAGWFMIWQTHDDLCLDVPEAEVAEIREIVRKAFTQNWPQLGGLAFGCDITVGDDYACD